MHTTKFSKLIMAYLLLLIPATMDAQVTVEAKIDSTQILIGQQVGITVEVSADAGKSVEFMQYDSLQQMLPGLEVLLSEVPDTEYLNDNKRVLLSKRYIVTSFDSSLYYIPPMQVVVDGEAYESNNLALKVLTMDIDTMAVDSIFPFKPEMKPTEP